MTPISRIGTHHGLVDPGRMNGEAEYVLVFGQDAENRNDILPEVPKLPLIGNSGTGNAREWLHD
jgi:hypothetical protein